jgi:hypothetical protein
MGIERIATHALDDAVHRPSPRWLGVPRSGDLAPSARTREAAIVSSTRA